MAGEGREGYGVTGDDGRRSENKAAVGFDTHARKGGGWELGRVPMPKGFGLIAPTDKNAFLPRTSSQLWRAEKHLMLARGFPFVSK